MESYETKHVWLRFLEKKKHLNSSLFSTQSFPERKIEDINEKKMLWVQPFFSQKVAYTNVSNLHVIVQIHKKSETDDH